MKVELDEKNYFFFSMFVKFCMSIRISIVRKLLHANHEEHLMTKFSRRKTKPTVYIYLNIISELNKEFPAIWAGYFKARLR